MQGIDLDSILGLIDSNQGEIICRDCLQGEELAHIPEEEVITADRLESGDTYFCSRCSKQL